MDGGKDRFVTEMNELFGPGSLLSVSTKTLCVFSSTPLVMCSQAWTGRSIKSAGQEEGELDKRRQTCRSSINTADINIHYLTALIPASC